jgi:4-carboxymuconolactone decarboxylase
MSGERFRPLALDEMSAEQRALADKILSGPRKSLSGPFSAFLYSPATGDKAQALGEQVRFHNALPEKLKELAILVVARFWTAQFEWYAHHRMALEAGLNPLIATDIAAGRHPSGMDRDETMIYDFAQTLLQTRAVTDAQFAAVRERFGEQGVVDLVCTMGYYCLVSMTLNVNRFPIPADATPLPPLS